MTNNNYNISRIENYLDSLLRNSVSANTFVGTLPDGIKDTWDDMCLIDCSSIISDENARARGVVMISLYARPRSDGSKNVNKMNTLEVALNAAIDGSNVGNSDYRIGRVGTYSDYDSNRNWHCNIVELNIIIS